MKLHFGLAAAALLVMGACSHGGSETKTSSTETQNPTPQASAGTSGTQAGGSVSAGGQTATGSAGTSAQNTPQSGATPPSGQGSTGAYGGTTSGQPQANVRSVTGQVAKVDSQSQSITVDQPSGSLTLTVDSSTQVTRLGRPLLGITSLHEGQQIRASFDPASNRAQRIEIMQTSPDTGSTTTPDSSDKNQNPDTQTVPSDEEKKKDY
jgi:hypothetical protein